MIGGPERMTRILLPTFHQLLVSPSTGQHMLFLQLYHTTNRAILTTVRPCTSPILRPITRLRILPSRLHFSQPSLFTLSPASANTTTTKESITASDTGTNIELSGSALSGIKGSKESEAVKEHWKSLTRWQKVGHWKTGLDLYGSTLKNYGVVTLAVSGVLASLNLGREAACMACEIEFQSLNIGEVAFGLGLLSALAIPLATHFVNRTLQGIPEVLYQSVLAKVINNRQVQSRMGTPLVAGHFHKCAKIPGGLRWKGHDQSVVGWKRFYHPPTIQLVFSLNGSRSGGVVSAELTWPHSTEPNYKSLFVDVLDNTNQPIILDTDPEHSASSNTNVFTTFSPLTNTKSN